MKLYRELTDDEVRTIAKQCVEVDPYLRLDVVKFYQAICEASTVQQTARTDEKMNYSKISELPDA